MIKLKCKDSDCGKACSDNIIVVVLSNTEIQLI